MPDVGTFELAAVVYHSGRTLVDGRYTCACRGPDKQFWRYEGSSARRSLVDIGCLLPRCVYVLIYTRPSGAAVFAGRKSLQVGEAGRDETSRTSRKAVGRDSVVVGAAASGAGTFSETCGKRPVLSAVGGETALEPSAGQDRGHRQQSPVPPNGGTGGNLPSRPWVATSGAADRFSPVPLKGNRWEPVRRAWSGQL